MKNEKSLFFVDVKTHKDPNEEAKTLTDSNKENKNNAGKKTIRARVKDYIYSCIENLGKNRMF